MIERIVKCLSILLAVDFERLNMPIKLCKEKGILTIQEFRQLSECGVPILSIYANTVGVDVKEVPDKIKAKEITYDDLLCIISMFTETESRRQML